MYLASRYILNFYIFKTYIIFFWTIRRTHWPDGIHSWMVSLIHPTRRVNRINISRQPLLQPRFQWIPKIDLLIKTPQWRIRGAEGAAVIHTSIQIKVRNVMRPTSLVLVINFRLINSSTLKQFPEFNGRKLMKWQTRRR